MTQDMADWLDQRETVMHAFNTCIRQSRERSAWLNERGMTGAAEAEDAYRQREIAKRDAWERDHEVHKPRA